MYWFPEHPDIELVVHGALPSTRAAVVLSAVGCGGQRTRLQGVNRPGPILWTGSMASDLFPP
jgi:hypothetical protein